MSEKDLRNFFADVRSALHINLGAFCDRNQIYRSDFTNFLKGKKYWTKLEDLDQMASDIMDHCQAFLDLYKKVV